MLSSTLLLVAAVLSSASAAPTSAAPASAAPASVEPSSSPADTSCSKGVHLIVARGSGEPPGEGPLHAISKKVEHAIHGSSDAAVIYPANLDNYEPSVEAGVAHMTAEVHNYVKRCPKSKIALVGYSQGAQVVGDVLGGGSYTNSKPLDHGKYSGNIVAAVQIADPSFVGGKPYDAGNYTNTGRYPRANTAALDKWGSKLVSYCTANDYYCDDGTDGNLHAMEVQIHEDAAAKFIEMKFKGHK